MAFESLTDRLAGVFKKLRGHGKLTEADIKAAMREVRMALLEADVNYKVAKDFCAKVSERAMGQEVMESLTPAQQVVKIVNEELIKLMGFLCSWKHVMEDCHTKALIQFSNFIFAGCVPDRWMPHVDFFNHFVLLIRDSSFNSFLKFLLLHKTFCCTLEKFLRHNIQFCMNKFWMPLQKIFILYTNIHFGWWKRNIQFNLTII